MAPQGSRAPTGQRTLDNPPCCSARSTCATGNQFRDRYVRPFFRFRSSFLTDAGISLQPHSRLCATCHSIRCSIDGFLGIGWLRCHSLFIVEAITLLKVSGIHPDQFLLLTDIRGDQRDRSFIPGIFCYVKKSSLLAKDDLKP